MEEYVKVLYCTFVRQSLSTNSFRIKTYVSNLHVVNVSFFQNCYIIYLLTQTRKLFFADTEESVFSNDFVSPGGTPYWTPKTTKKPKVDDVFDSYNAAVETYKSYAFEAGFDIRKGSSTKINGGIITTKYLLCNREGKPNTGNVDTVNIQYKKIKRRKDLHRTECKAHIVFKLIPGTDKYVVHKFVENHNHMLISKDNMQFSHTSRQLNFTTKTFLHNMTIQNVGAAKSYRLLTGIQGGCSTRGGLLVDFKNYMRDLNCFIGGSDAQLIVNIMEDRSKYASNFTFECRVVEKQLNAMFWADETAKYNYKEFGEVVSFDATFDTNR